MIKNVLVSILLFLSLGSAAQDPIDFNPKVLFAELEKFAALNDSKVSSLVQITELPVPSEDFSHTKGKYFSVSQKSGSNAITHIYMGRVNSCRAGGCSASHETGQIGGSEYFDYFILFDTAQVVRSVKVYNYQATHGQEITARGWLKQFAGYDGSKYLEVGTDIDGISGATISVYGITADIGEKSRILKEILN